MIFFPQEQPIKFFEWTKRTEAAAVRTQVVHFRDNGMYQIQDVTRSDHRVVLLNSSFTPIAEIVSPELTLVTVGGNNVITWEVNWDTYYSIDDKAYIGIVDANTNKFLQNYVPNGTFATADNWTSDDASATVGSGSMTFTTGSGDTAEVVHSSVLFTGKDYTFTVQVTSNTGGVAAGFYNGATLIDSLTVGANTFTFTATDEQFSIQFSILGAGTMVIDFITGSMAFADVTPEWVSAPFCVKDVAESMSLLHGCSNNDYFNMYFADTDFIPRIRARIQLNDTAPIQEGERSFMTNGTTSNHYLQHVSVKELLIDWFPAYLINFIAIWLYLDHAYVDNVEYSLAEDIDVHEDANAPKIKAAQMKITLKENGVSFKRVVNDPDAGGCSIATDSFELLARGFDMSILDRVTDESIFVRQ